MADSSLFFFFFNVFGYNRACLLGSVVLLVREVDGYMYIYVYIYMKNLARRIIKAQSTWMEDFTLLEQEIFQLSKPNRMSNYMIPSFVYIYAN